MLALAHELDQLEPVDVRHVDVGDDQVVRAARQEPQRVEAARRFDDLDLAERAGSDSSALRTNARMLRSPRRPECGAWVRAPLPVRFWPFAFFGCCARGAAAAPCRGRSRATGAP